MKNVITAVWPSAAAPPGCAVVITPISGALTSGPKSAEDEQRADDTPRGQVGEQKPRSAV